MSQFNKLEKSIFEWFQNQDPNTSLSKQIESAEFIRRDWTKVGFYVYIQVDHNLSPINDRKFPINGPNIESKDIDCGGGTLLWGTHGYVDCIEMFAFGDYFRKNIRQFKLSE